MCLSYSVSCCSLEPIPFSAGPQPACERVSFSHSTHAIPGFPGLFPVNPPFCSFQLKKLGVMPPEQPLPVKCNRIYQIMWANNGDSISRQYAGTAALKVGARQERWAGLSGTRVRLWAPSGSVQDRMPCRSSSYLRGPDRSWQVWLRRKSPVQVPG